MKDTALYEHLLGLKAPWSVKKVDLSLADQRVVVEVVLKKAQVWADPTDATKRAHINGWTERQWRHLDTCQFETIIKARIPQLKYSDGTVEELKVPWAERYSRVTTLVAAFVIKLLEVCPTTHAVCTLTRLSWSTVNAIMVSAVERGMLRRTEEEISYLGIDEKSSEKGHTYASILTDIDRSRVLDLVPERKLAAAVSLLETLTAAQRISVIRYVSPQQRHAGEDHAILAARHALYTTAKERHPARWSGNTRNWQPIGAVTLNPERDSVVSEHAMENYIQQLAA